MDPDERAMILKRFGATLRARREKAGMSQEKLADLAGLDRTYVGGIERGERNVALLNLVKLSRALGAQPSEVLKVLDAPQPGQPSAD